MNDEIGLDEDIEPTAEATEGVKGGVSAADAKLEDGLAKAAVAGPLKTDSINFTQVK
jgi:hypothetical protein